MPVRILSVSIDAGDPPALARFWAHALRWEVAGARDAVRVVPTDGTPFALAFRRVSQRKRGLNRIHFDLTTTSLEDQRDSLSALLARGARHVDVGQGPEQPHVVLADPEGNELCLIEPQNRFLAGCGRLGALSCDGSRTVGHFWSRALDWPLVWDDEGETAVRSPDGSGPFVTWGGGPRIPKIGVNRVRLDVAPVDGASARGELARLVSLGAARSDVRLDDESETLLDPDGNEFRLVAPSPQGTHGAHRPVESERHR